MNSQSVELQMRCAVAWLHKWHRSILAGNEPKATHCSRATLHWHKDRSQVLWDEDYCECMEMVGY